PLIFMEVVEEAVVPLRRVVGPCALEPARDRVGALAGTGGVLPSDELRLYRRGLRFRTDVLRTVRTMGLADGMAADDERNGFLVVHRHASERFANVPCCRERIRLPAGPLGIHVDQTHLHCAERLVELAIAAVALISEPRLFRAPENLVGCPFVFSPEAEAERLEAHRFISNVAGEDDQIGPGDFPAVLLLDRPEQPPRFVEVRVVGPTVEGSKALHPTAATPT